jgi:hypothetical protein
MSRPSPLPPDPPRRRKGLLIVSAALLAAWMAFLAAMAAWG